MTEDILPPEMLARFQPEYVSEGLLHLVSEDAPTRAILCAGGGAFEAAHITLTQGIFVKELGDIADTVAARYADIADRSGEIVPENGMLQTMREMEKIKLGG